MSKYINNSVFKYMLIASLAVTLTLGQAFKLHMHIEHDEVLSTSLSEHKLDVHIASSLHDSIEDTHHQDHHSPDIKVSPDTVVKKIESSSLSILLFSIIILFLGLPRLRCIFIQNIQSKLSSSYYLFNPPLRAPPVHSLV